MQKVISEQDIIFSGEPAKKQEVIDYEGKTRTHIEIKNMINGHKMYVDLLNQEYAPVFDKILSTFRFLEPDKL